jgi:Ca2+-binding EF-hand superfamily protein
VLVFPNSEEKLLFIELLRFYGKELRKMPPHLDALLLSFFTLIDENRSMTLSLSEIEHMLGYLKLGRKDYLDKVIAFVREDEQAEGELSFRQFERVMGLM